MDAAPSLHPTDQALNSYGLGKLDDRSAEAVDAHLEGCPDCRKRVAEMSADSFLERVRGARKPPGKSTSGQSQAGGILGDKGPTAPVLPTASTLPPGLADHPDYEIKKELGRGGMGVVYLAHNELMGRDEVLKVMGREIVRRPGVLERFLREIRTVARLRHPNIVTAYSAVRLGESIVFAMEYVEGLDLSKMVKAKGPLPVSHACNFVHQAALGLQHAHEEGLVHRDIKPANLMLSRKGDRATVKVLDFGLAKAAREEKVDGGLTSEGQALGTPDYIAPEQILDAPSADIRADIYSLGGTLHYLLTGRPPFKANSLYDMYQAHISRDADPLNLVRPEVPVELAALVAKMMAKDPARRFQTPGEVAQALTPFFKKANAAFKRPEVDESQAIQAGADRPMPGSDSPPNQPGMGLGKMAVGPKNVSDPTPDEGRWESLIVFREEESPGDATPAEGPTWWPPWAWASLVVGVLMLGFVAAWLGGVFKVKTPEGVIVLEDVPKDSEVLVDGDKITFSWPGIGMPLEIRAVPGQRKVEVKKDRFRTFGEVVTVEANGSESVTVRLEPLGAATPEKGPIDRGAFDANIKVNTNIESIVNNARGNFPVQISPGVRATLRDGKAYINEAFGRKNVLCTEALSPSSPATIDFSGITKDGTGRLILMVHGYPGHLGQKIVVKVDGVISTSNSVHFADGWKRIEVPFGRDAVVVEHHAEGWSMEFVFVDYEVIPGSTPETSHTSAIPGPDRSPAGKPHVPFGPRVASAPATVAFRQGVDGYAGVFGLNYSGSAQPEHPQNPCLWADWPDAGQEGTVAILRFHDLCAPRTGRIPPGSRIITAKLRLVTGNDGSGHGARIHRLKKSIDFKDVVKTLLNDARGDRFAILAASTAGVGSPTLQRLTEPGPIELDVTADVEAWAAGMANHGWAFLPWPNGTDGWGFLKPDCAEVADRPSLTVTYIPPPIGHSPGGAGGSTTSALHRPARPAVAPARPRTSSTDAEGARTGQSPAASGRDQQRLGDLALPDRNVPLGQALRLLLGPVTLRSDPPQNGAPGAFRIVAPFRTRSPVADGAIGPDEYGPPLVIDLTDDKNPGLDVVTAPNPAKDRNDLSADLYLAHAREALFVAVKVRDDVLIDRPGASNICFNDAVELYLDGDRLGGDLKPGSHEGFQIASTARGRKYSVGVGTSDQDYVAKASTFDGGYIVEFRIPLATIDTADGARVAPPGSGSTLRFNLAIIDNDQPVETQERFCVLWSEDRTNSPMEGDGAWPVDLHLARAVKYELVAGPKGAAIDPETGLFTWDAAKESRTEKVTIRVRDAEKPEITAGASFTITTTSGTTASRAIKSPAGAPPGKPLTPTAAGAPDNVARALHGKTPATRRRGGGTGDADITPPFRVATNGLAGSQYIDPVRIGPDDWLFNEQGTAVPWATKDSFARLTTRAALGYPQLPVSRYVCEVELTIHKRGDMTFCLGDPVATSLINFWWNPEREISELKLWHRHHRGASVGGHRDFAPEGRISLKLAVGDGIQMLFHENKPIKSLEDCWPTDCRLVIWSETSDSAVIHRCSLRPLTEQDVADCGWTTPPTDLALNVDETAKRLAKISEGYPAQPKARQNFALKTTGTPMAWIPPGDFEMGSRNPKDEQEPRHRVRLTRGYWMAQVEVTQGEFRKVTGANPSRVTGSPYLPVDWVAWDQATAYCRKLTNLERKHRRLPRGYEYRLPTEAEWEYACRAGSDEDFSIPVKLVWSGETSGRRPHEIAASQPNKWGLYDMHGNAMEWCLDAWYDYPKGTKEVTVDPFKLGQPNKDTFVVRGGAWWTSSHDCASHWRYLNHNNPNGFRGFRIVLGTAINPLEQ